jgi:hypothetical protein
VLSVISAAEMAKSRTVDDIIQKTVNLAGNEKMER